MKYETTSGDKKREEGDDDVSAMVGSVGGIGQRDWRGLAEPDQRLRVG